MASDRGALVGVASLALLFGCGPSVKPGSVPAEPSPVGQGAPKPLKVDPQGRQVVVGEMCPQGAGGRPAVTPILMRGVSWNDTYAEVTATVERGTVPQFVVFGVDGKQAGAFETLGLLEVAPNQSVASGAYVGASPCTYSVTAKPDAGKLDTRGEDPKCGAATKGCGIAVGEITQSGEAPASVFATGGACMSGNDLAVDIDGDGVIESFPIANVLDGIRAPAAEWTASPPRVIDRTGPASEPGPSATPTGAAPCQPTFQVYDLKLAPSPRQAKAPVKGVGAVGDAVVTVDVLAVVDIDADGRKEIVLAMRFPTTRSIVVYTAPDSAQRLEKAGEGQSFAR